MKLSTFKSLVTSVSLIRHILKMTTSVNKINEIKGFFHNIDVLKN